MNIVCNILKFENSKFPGHYLLSFLILTFLGLHPPFDVAGQELKRYEFESRHMGTMFRIVLYSPRESTAHAASDSAFKKIEELNNYFSDYKEDSELNRLSARSGTEEFFPVSPPLFHVLSKAQDLAYETHGAFDVTVGPFVQLWRGIRRSKDSLRSYINKIDEVAESVGYQYLKTDRSNLSVALTRRGMKLDLGGIAKGYAADRALQVLNEFGIKSALIDAGGDITLGNAPPDRKGWRIVIPIHNEQGEEKRMTLILSNQAVATSGDLFQYVELNGKRYSHIINPKTGMGLPGQSTVTVVAPDGITADSYASAVSVMGPVKGLKYVESTSGVAAYMEFKKEGKFHIRKSAGFKKLKKLNL